MFPITAPCPSRVSTRALSVAKMCSTPCAESKLPSCTTLRHSAEQASKQAPRRLRCRTVSLPKPRTASTSSATSTKPQSTAGSPSAKKSAPGSKATARLHNRIHRANSPASPASVFAASRRMVSPAASNRSLSRMESIDRIISGDTAHSASTADSTLHTAAD